MSDPVTSFFLDCPHSGERCPTPTALQEFHAADVGADYRFPDAGGGEWPLTPGSNTPPCVLFTLVRRAISLGRYGEAFQALQHSIPGTGCWWLLVLEYARLLWFVEDYVRAEESLGQIASAETVPHLVRFRARNLQLAIANELYCAAILGYPGQAADSRADPISLAALAEREGNAVVEAQAVGDHEAIAWIRLDHAVAEFLVAERPDPRPVEKALKAIPLYGIPHAQRKVGCAFAVREFVAPGADNLLAGYTTAATTYPANVVTLKLALDLLHVSRRSGAPSLVGQATSLARDAIRCFVREQFTLKDSPLAARAERTSERFLGCSMNEIASGPSSREVLWSLGQIRWATFESGVARPLLARLFADVTTCPRSEPHFDFIVTQRGAGDVGLRFGVQVKSGRQTIKQRDIPGANLLANAGLQGYVAVAVQRISANAARELASLRQWGFVGVDWTGDQLAERILQFPELLRQITRLAGTPPLPGA